MNGASAGFGLTVEEKKSLQSSKLAFPNFVQAMRDQVLLEKPSYSYNEIQKELSKAWKHMSRDEKLIWANAELDCPQPSTSKRVTYPKRSASLPVPPKSAYSLFSQCARKQLLLEFPDLTAKDIPGVCSELWKNLPSSERALWQADAENDRLRYQRELSLLQQNSSPGSATLPTSEAMNETSSSGATIDERMKVGRKNKSPKNEVPQVAPAKSLKKPSASSSSTFPENAYGDFFTQSDGLRINLNEGAEENNDLLPGDNTSLKISSHDSFFEDHLTYDTTLFVDSDPFQTDIDLFSGIASPAPPHRHLDSKHFLHEDLSLFGHDCISNFI